MNRSRTSLALISAMALLIVLLAACKDTSLFPVFYTLENERELVDDRGMDDNAIVFKVISTGPLSTDEYFAAAGSVYRREKDGGTWQKIAPPVAGALCNHIEYFADTGDIVAWFYAFSNGAAVGLYRTAADPIAWLPIALPADFGDVTMLKQDPSVANRLLVGASEAGVFKLFTVSNAYAVAATDTLSKAARDVAHDGTNYWLITVEPFTNPLPPPDKLYLYWDPAAGGLGTLATDNTGPVVTTGAAGLHYDGAGRLYLSTEDGKIFFRSAGSWSTWSGDPVQVNSQSVRFTQFVEADPGFLFVGTEATGYYRFSPAAGTSYQASDFTRQPSYNISALYNGAVRSFLAVDDPLTPAIDPDTLFACTYGNGLWRADYAGGSEPWPWVQE